MRVSRIGLIDPATVRGRPRTKGLLGQREVRQVIEGSDGLLGSGSEGLTDPGPGAGGLTVLIRPAYPELVLVPGSSPNAVPRAGML